MDYQTPSRNQKKKSPTDRSSRPSPSRHSSSSLSESASLRYYTALATSSTPYQSPYTQDEDRPTQLPTGSASRTSAKSTTSNSIVDPSYKAPSPPTKDSLSTYSSSSGGSLYTSPTMSSVSQTHDLLLFTHQLSSAIRTTPVMLISCSTLASVVHNVPSFASFSPCSSNKY